MNIRMRLIAVVAGGLGLWMGSAPGQEVPVDCNKAARPGRIEGEVVKVDMDQGKLTMRAADGKLHEFQTSRETLKDYKVGDSIKAKLRADPRCD